jgi:hypothetical protein
MNVFRFAAAATYAAIVFLMMAMLVGAQTVDALAGAGLAQVTIPVDFGGREAMVMIILAFAMSPIISFINRLIPPGQWSSEAKAVLTFAVCLVAALLVVVARGQLNATDWFGTFLLLFVSATVLYTVYFKPSGIAAAISGT